MARRGERRTEFEDAGARGTGPAYWQRMAEEHVRSGLTVPAFCRERGLPFHRFHYWKYVRLAGRVRKPRTMASVSQLAVRPRLVPVEVVLDPPAPRRSAGSGTEGGRLASEGSGVEVVLPRGLRVAVERGFDGGVLRKVVEVLGC